MRLIPTYINFKLEKYIFPKLVIVYFDTYSKYSYSYTFDETVRTNGMFDTRYFILFINI